ncbi:hypothetical protein [Nocardia sp. NPDC050435]|uniref:hypothetical protein n=1 Tax=Nocardia sp. NPDC050435 TaxID=3155040 RepID=UPI0034086475
MQGTEVDDAEGRDPEPTEIIGVARGHLVNEPLGDHEDTGHDDDVSASSAAFTDDDEDAEYGDFDHGPADEGSRWRRSWNQGIEYLRSAQVRRHLPYAAVAAIAATAVVGALIVTTTKPESADDVTDTAASSEDWGTQSFDDLSGLNAGLDTTSPVEATTFPELTPTEEPLPDADPLAPIDPSAEPIALPGDTITETVPVDPVDSNPVTETITETPTESPTTITETPSGPDWPNISVSASVPDIGSNGSNPSTVTVVVPADPSTVTITATPATTTKPNKTTTPKPGQCRPTTTPAKPSTTTPKKTTPPKTSSSSPTTTTKKKPTTTTKTTKALPPCR